MTEKQFILDDEGEYIKNTKTGEYWDACGGGDGVPMLIDLVNKLLKEKKSLERDIRRYKDTINVNVDIDNEICEQLKKTERILKEIRHENKTLKDKNQKLKSMLVCMVEQLSENDKLLSSDIRILEKALWCEGCANDIKRLKELRREFLGGE